MIQNSRGEAERLNPDAGRSTAGSGDPPALLHGLSAVGISTVAGQWYCEKKVDLSFRHREIPIGSPALASGVEGHEALSRDAEPVSAEAFEEALRRGETVTLQESGFEGRYLGVSILGVPDLVTFQGRSGRLLLEFKFSRRRALFIDRSVQAQLYGWLLEQSGYETDRLICAVCVVSPALSERDPQGGPKIQGDLLRAILARYTDARSRRQGHPMIQAAPLTLEEEDWSLHAFRYDREAAEGYLKWALGYWLGKRAPRPTRHGAKCGPCPYNTPALCPGAAGAERRRNDPASSS